MLVSEKGGGIRGGKRSEGDDDGSRVVKLQSGTERGERLTEEDKRVGSGNKNMSFIIYLQDTSSTTFRVMAAQWSSKMARYAKWFLDKEQKLYF